MPVTTANRATIAGLGSTAALLAAVLAVSLVVGGLVAYSGSPAGPLVSREPRLALPGTADGTALGARRAAAPIVLPSDPATAAPATAAAAATQVGSGDGAPVRGATRGPAPASGGPATPTGADPQPVAGSASGTPTPVATPSAPALPTVPVPTGGLADATAATGQALGGTLRQTLGVVGAAVGGVSPPLGQAVNGLGAGLDGTVTQTTDGLAGVLRRLGG